MDDVCVEEGHVFVEVAELEAGVADGLLDLEVISTYSSSSSSSNNLHALEEDDSHTSSIPNSFFQHLSNLRRLLAP